MKTITPTLAERATMRDDSLTVRRLAPETKARLRKLAAEDGKPLEAYVRQLLDETGRRGRPRKTVVQGLDEIRATLNGDELEIPERVRGNRPIPTFE